jgi:hypothetical protein
MVGKSFPDNLTKEEYLFLRRWKYGVAITYGIAVLWLVGFVVLTTSGTNSVEATAPTAQSLAARHQP